MKTRTKKIAIGSSLAGIILIGAAGTAYASAWNNESIQWDEAQHAVMQAKSQLDESTDVYDKTIKNIDSKDITQDGYTLMASVSASALKARAYDGTVSTPKPKMYQMTLWQLRDDTQELNDTANHMREERSSINDRIARINKELEKHKTQQAQKALNNQLDKARKLYKASSGLVMDEATRQQLQQWIESSASMLNAKGTTAESYTKQANKAGTIITAVKNSQSEYQKEQERQRELAAQANIQASYGTDTAPNAYYTSQPGYNQSYYQKPSSAQPQAAPAPTYSSQVNASCDTSYYNAPGNPCQGAVDQGGMVDITYYNGDTHIYSQHNGTGGAWINNLKPGDTVSLGGKQFTVNDYSKQGAVSAPDKGYYAQTCNENGNHLVGLTPKN